MRGRVRDDHRFSTERGTEARHQQEDERKTRESLKKIDEANRGGAGVRGGTASAGNSSRDTVGASVMDDANDQSGGGAAGPG
jgi:hypothetical protein